MPFPRIIENHILQSFNNRVICRIPRFRWTHNNGPFYVLCEGGSRCGAFPSPNQNTLAIIRACLFPSPPHPKNRGDKRVWQILPIISCRVLCFLYSMNPCVTLCQWQIVCSCHHVVICVTNAVICDEQSLSFSRGINFH